MSNERIDNLKDELEVTPTEEPTTEEPTETEPIVDEPAAEPAEPVSTEEPGTEETPVETPAVAPVAPENAFVMPDKFKGKSAQEIAEAYSHLETRLGTRPVSNTERKALKSAGIDPKDLPGIAELSEEITGMDFETGMSPQDYAIWLSKRIMGMVQNQAQDIYQASSKVQRQVKSESQAAKEKFPLLGTNPEYTNFVLSLVQMSAEQGNDLSLMEACQQVTDQIGTITKAQGLGDITPAETAPVGPGEIETPGSVVPGTQNTEQDDVVNGIFNAGPKSGGLGGL
ncbi:hypothetical protein KAU11_10290 [Candidatus Babeliales bacterium]|nr:hypothetical protein [Candidatus Babeliales bacterium]